MITLMSCTSNEKVLGFASLIILGGSLKSSSYEGLQTPR